VSVASEVPFALQQLEENMRRRQGEELSREPRALHLWAILSDEDLEYNLSIGLTPEKDPEEFAPTEVRVSDIGYKQMRLYAEAHEKKWGHLPKGITREGDPKPTYAQIRLPLTQQEALSELVAVRADSIKSKAITWLWNFRIPMNKLSVLAGNPDQGKSLVSLYMIAQLTRGFPMFGDAKSAFASEVLLMAAEDDAADTIVPRLIAAGADMKKIHILSSVMQKSATSVPEEREAQLDRDVQIVENFLKAHPGIRMVVIDPISSFLGRVNMNREQEVRGILTPLKNLAERREVAIVTVMHLNKVGDQSAIHRIGGAVAFTGVARAVWLFMQDDNDKDKHLMLRVKNNIAKATGGLVFNIDSKHVKLDSGDSASQPVIKWVGETEDSAADVLLMGNGGRTGRPDVKVTTAKEWLASFLGDGQQTSADIQAFGKKAGHSWGTIQRAKDEIGVHSFQQERKWYWKTSSRGVGGLPSENKTVNLD
jgi:putative DNA primase/helicase